MLKVYGITYGNHKTEYLEYRNEFKEKLWRFENNCMIDIIEKEKSAPEFHWNNDYLGIFSCRFREKTGISSDRLFNTFHNAKILIRHIDVYNLSPDLGNNIAGYGNFMDWSEAGHKGIKKLIQACCDHIGIIYENNPDQVIYANQFIARKSVYIDYIERVIKPCLELLEGPLWNQVNVEAGYTAGLEKEELKKYTGLDFYNFLPFICERMMMQYVHSEKLKTIRLI